MTLWSAAPQRNAVAASSLRRDWVAPALFAAVIGTGVLACGAADDSRLPPDVQDPAVLKTPSGAVARYRGALGHFPAAFDNLVTASGLITDELASLPTPRSVVGEYGAIDSRTDLTAISQRSSDRYHRVRAQAREARGFLAAYAPDSSPALQGHLYALEAYADVFLADLFCSGIPLSTVDFEGNYTLTAGFTTAEVYHRAVALFDSALALTGDSARLQQFAAVGKGRALLALGQYAAAAAAVSAVPDDYSYQITFTHPESFAEASDPLASAPDSAALWYFKGAAWSKPGVPSVTDREGQHGLDYRSSGDPRTVASVVATDPLGNSMYFPDKYPDPVATVFTVASGVEARLIEAEAALQATPEDGRWLAILNHLRQAAWSTIVPTPAGPLPDLADPGTASGRVDLLFRERAFWLYLTGHREGDLRHLLRDYPGYSADAVYPSGAYPGASGTYGSEIVVPIPSSERELNPKYTGCFHRDA